MDSDPYCASSNPYDSGVTTNGVSGCYKCIAIWWENPKPASVSRQTGSFMSQSLSLDMAMSNSLPKLQAEGNMLRSSKAEEDVEDESYPFVEGVNDSTRSMSARYLEPQRTNMWMVTTFVLTFLLLASGIRDYIHSRQSVSKDYGYDTGFDTEWRKSIKSLA